MKNKKSVIYVIKNKITNQIYVGQSANYRGRISFHKSVLRNNKHGNMDLQNSWNKYGEDNFIFRIIEKVEIHQLDDRERFWIEYYNSNNNDFGFNKDNGGTKNKKLSKETKRKISENHADVSGENNPFYNKKHTLETIEKIQNHPNYIKNNDSIRGENHHKAKLTKSEVLEIKSMLKQGIFTLTHIAEKFQVSISAISHIKQGRTWSDV